MVKLPKSVKHCPDCLAYYTIGYPHVCDGLMKMLVSYHNDKKRKKAKNK
jgi:hypothetical protein